MRDAGAGVVNFGVAFDEVGGLSMNDVSVVLESHVLAFHASMNAVKVHTRTSFRRQGLHENVPSLWSVLHVISRQTGHVHMRFVLNWSSSCRALRKESGIGAYIDQLMIIWASNTAPYLWKVHTEGVHVQAIQETRKALAEPGETLVHQLHVHEIGLEICH